MELPLKISLIAEGLFNRFGIKSISMDDVSKELGISKKTLYKYFKDKDSMVHSIVESHVFENEKSILHIITSENNPINQFYKIAKHVINNPRKMNPAMINDLKKYHSASFALFETHQSTNILNHLKENIFSGQRLGLFRKQINAEVIAHVFAMVSFSVFENLTLNNLDISQNDIFMEVTQYHLRAIATDQGIIEIDSINWKNYNPEQ